MIYRCDRGNKEYSAMWCAGCSTASQGNCPFFFEGQKGYTISREQQKSGSYVTFARFSLESLDERDPMRGGDGCLTADELKHLQKMRNRH